MLDALVEDVERRRHREDRLPVLHGGHPAGGEGPAVTNPVDEIDDRHDRVARTQEVPVQRMDMEVLVDGPHRRHQRLAGDLTAEGPREHRLRRDPPEDVLLESLEFQDLFDLRHVGSPSRDARRDARSG